MRKSVWENLISEHGAKLVLFALRWANDRTEAEDWVQEGMVRLWKRFESVESPVLYLYRCVRTIAMDSIRQRKARQRRETSFFQYHPRKYAEFQSELEGQEWVRSVELAMRRLPAEQSEVVTLKIWSQLTFAEIAKVTQTPIGTVASRYRYALKSLKPLLSENAVE